MPSPFPRLMIVLTPEQHQLLTRLSDIQGKPKAAYVRRLLDLAVPHLRALLSPLERAIAEEEAMDEGFQCALQDALQDAEEELEEQLELADFLDVQEALERQWEASNHVDDIPPPEHVQGGGVSSPEAAGPPYSNTGVRDPGTEGSKVVRLQRKVG